MKKEKLEVSKNVGVVIGATEAFFLGVLMGMCLKESEIYTELVWDGDFFGISNQRITQEYGLSPYQQTMARVKLEKAGLVETKKRGYPRLILYKINAKAVNDFTGKEYV